MGMNLILLELLFWRKKNFNHRSKTCLGKKTKKTVLPPPSAAINGPKDGDDGKDEDTKYAGDPQVGGLGKERVGYNYPSSIVTTETVETPWATTAEELAVDRTELIHFVNIVPLLGGKVGFNSLLIQ